MQLPGGQGGGTPAPGTQTPSPDSSAKTRDKHSTSSPAPDEGAPKKSRKDVDVPSKKALTLKKPRSYHMSKKEIEQEERPTKAHAVSFLYFSKSYFFSIALACPRNSHPCAVDVTIPE
jgi:hypothetical protein